MGCTLAIVITLGPRMLGCFRDGFGLGIAAHGAGDGGIRARLKRLGLIENRSDAN
jgi:hypothetical protein